MLILGAATNNVNEKLERVPKPELGNPYEELSLERIPPKFFIPFSFFIANEL